MTFQTPMLNATEEKSLADRNPEAYRLYTIVKALWHEAFSNESKVITLQDRVAELERKLSAK